jgi:uncharacterized protein YkwD
VAYHTVGRPSMDGSAQDTHNRWMKSSGHAANIKNSAYTKVGYSYYKCDKSNRWAPEAAVTRHELHCFWGPLLLLSFDFVFLQ